jgi:hypothetical protein
MKLFVIIILISLSTPINLKQSDIKFLNMTKLTDDNDNQITFSSKLKDALLLYLQFFTLFIILSIHRQYEEMFKIICLYIDNKYSNFINLNELNAKDYDGCYVYVSGKVHISKPVQDDRFILPDLTDCVKLERIVEILYPNSTVWILPEEDFEIKNDKMVYTYLGHEYTFPYIVFKTTHGEVISFVIIA